MLGIDSDRKYLTATGLRSDCGHYKCDVEFSLLVKRLATSACIDSTGQGYNNSSLRGFDLGTSAVRLGVISTFRLRKSGHYTVNTTQAPIIVQFPRGVLVIMDSWNSSRLLKPKGNITGNAQFIDLQRQSEFMHGNQRKSAAARVNAKGAFGDSRTVDVPVFKAHGVQVRSLDFFSPPPMPIIASVTSATSGFPTPKKIIPRSKLMADRY